eukprot:TRINITY_DN607_c0_g3_i1.p1 TRINITY_DN607_c0_g3~~TRINITY_DN607_c0_g3_i1.p1  ORF type:complete len:451 (+),score=121.30 TRINITY_DN607_c0_g3_i1:337-1689(+)
MGKSVLVLGAGYCTRPLVHYLSQNGIDVVVGSRTEEKAKKLIEGAERATVVRVDVETEDDLKALEEVVAKVDAVVSMLPYLYHARVAEIAIRHKKHFLTTSYVSDAMKTLNDKAIEAGIIVVNECGVDPGTDHMSAMRVIDQIHAKGGKVVSFKSYCGGLPALENNNNPLGYKFSWAPRGVLLASRNSALFLRDGSEVTIPGADLFDNYEIHQIEGISGEYEAYPNRNSTTYLDVYNLRGECKTIIRGTYRNKGWCPAIKKLSDLGYLDITERDLSSYKSYADLTASLLSDDSSTSLAEKVAKKLGLAVDHEIVKIIEWLGLLGSDSIPDVKTPLDALCAAMLARMQYAPGERDLLLMRHTFIAEFPEEKKRRYYSSRLIDFGIKDGDTSMSRTVSYPVAIVTKLVLEGKYDHLKGLQIPLTPEFYNPILAELEALNIKFMDQMDREEDM